MNLLLSGRQSGLDIKLSKSLSYILRHGAEKEGIRLDEGGFAFVDDILARPHLKRFTFTDVERVVADNDKQRFSLIIDKDTGRSKIRANQGHTLEVIADHLVLQQHVYLYGSIKSMCTCVLDTRP